MSEEHKCGKCGDTAITSAMNQNGNGEWFHLRCWQPEAVKEYAMDGQTQKTIDDSFTYHAPKADQIPRYTQLREKFRETALMIARYTPPGRERAIALTQLQLANMAANAAIACGEK